jgi:hypothetical protein
MTQRRVPVGEPPAWVATIREKVLEGKSNHQIATEVGRPKGRVASAIHRWFPGLRRDLFSSVMVSRILGVSQGRVEAWMKDGRLEYYNVAEPGKGAVYKITRSNLERFLDDPDNSHLWDPTLLWDGGLRATYGSRPRQWLSVKEFARATGYSERHAHYLMHNGLNEGDEWRWTGTLHVLHMKVVDRYRRYNAARVRRADRRTHFGTRPTSESSQRAATG